MNLLVDNLTLNITANQDNTFEHIITYTLYTYSVEYNIVYSIVYTAQ